MAKLTCTKGCCTDSGMAWTGLMGLCELLATTTGDIVVSFGELVVAWVLCSDWALMEAAMALAVAIAALNWVVSGTGDDDDVVDVVVVLVK